MTLVVLLVTAADGGENVTAGVGRQLATTLTAAGESVRGDVSRATSTERFRRANESQRAELLADRAATLTDRAAAVDARLGDLTAAYRAGDLAAGEFAFQTALVAVRAEAVAADLTRLRRLAEDVSGLELAAAGYDGDRVSAALSTAESAAGPAATALRRQFTRGGDSRVTGAGGAVVELEEEIGTETDSGPPGDVPGRGDDRGNRGEGADDGGDGEGDDDEGDDGDGENGEGGRGNGRGRGA